MKGGKQLTRARTNRISIEELANSVTHGIGLALSIAGFVVLLVLAVMRGSAWHIVSCAIYGTTLVCLYTASTLYHGISWLRVQCVFGIPNALAGCVGSLPRRFCRGIPVRCMDSGGVPGGPGSRDCGTTVRTPEMPQVHPASRDCGTGDALPGRALKIFDHCAIYLLIAGTYTPFTLVNLRGAWGWSLFGVVWGLAFAGILFKLWFGDRFKILSTLVYLAMGWIALIAVKPLLLNVPAGGLSWLLAGGALYTLGVVFYACRKVPYNHAVWHLFVMAGSICHYFAVLYSVVLPAKT